MAAWTKTSRPNHGCSQYKTSRRAILWAFSNLVLQRNTPPFLAGIPATSPSGAVPRAPGCATPSSSAGRSAAGPKADHELTLRLDHPMGADHPAQLLRHTRRGRSGKGLAIVGGTPRGRGGFSRLADACGLCRLKHRGGTAVAAARPSSCGSVALFAMAPPRKKPKFEGTSARSGSHLAKSGLTKSS